jgi:hypothetical protein
MTIDWPTKAPIYYLVVYFKKTYFGLHPIKFLQNMNTRYEIALSVKLID